jgi:RNA polymerase sigma factor (sigma-70 family)
VTPDEQRLERLARTCGPRVLAYLARRASPQDVAADLFQQVLVTTWSRIARVPDEDEAALCWMLATARRHLANHHRAEHRRLAGTDRLRDTIRVLQPTDPGDGQLIEAVDQLPPDDLELVRLVYWDDLSTEQAGAVLGIRPATARKRLQRARSRVRQLLEMGPPLDWHARAVCSVTAGPDPT